MRRLALVAALALAMPAGAQEIDPSTAVSVEMTAEREAWFVGEMVTVDVRLGYDAAFFDDHVIQPFQRELDVPLRLSAPWITEQRFPSGGVLILPADGVAVLVNELEVAFTTSAGPEERGGRAYTVLAAELTFEAAAPGTIDLSSAVEMTVATSFRDDFVEGRVAVDPRSVRLRFSGPGVRVLPLPEEGRPPGFSGGVGAFEIVASLMDTHGRDPELVHLSLSVRGLGSHRDLVVPPLTALEGFHVRAAREDRLPGGRGRTRWANWYRYELERVDPTVATVPAIPFSFFDPSERAYRTIYTDPIPLPSDDVLDPPAAAPTTTDANESGPAAGMLVAFGLIAIVGLSLMVLLRRRRGLQRGAHVGPAASALRALDASDADAANVLTTILAARLDCLSAAVITPDLARRLVASGTPEDVARDAATLLERLVAARYGGEPGSPDDVAATRSVIERLDGAAHHG